jgi:type VI secretion system secreted protein Hcp
MANNIHMKITGPDIQGEGSDANHVGEIVVQTVQQGLARLISSQGAAGTREVSNVSVSEVVITKLVDSATPLIAKSCCVGGEHDEVKIVFEKKAKNGAVVGYLVYTMKQVIISGQSISGMDGESFPMETVSLNFNEIKWEYTPTDPTTGDAKGVVPFGYSVGKNQEV